MSKRNIFYKFIFCTLLIVFAIVLLLIFDLKKNISTSPNNDTHVMETEVQEIDKEEIEVAGTLYKETTGDVWFSGRWFQKEIDGKVYNVTLNAGAMMYFSVEGTRKVDINFLEMGNATTPFYAYSIDNEKMVRRRITEKSIILPDDKRHVIQIVVDSLDGNDDKWNQEIGVAFKNVYAYGGNVKAVYPEQNRILFIGDSITEGSMIFDFFPVAENNSVINSFSWKTAKLLSAEPYIIGFASTGITKNGIFTTTSKMLDYYSATRVIPENHEISFDLIVLFVGTNDYDAGKDIFMDGYKEVLEKLHKNNPQTKIVCMIPFSQNHSEEIREITEQNDWCYAVDTYDWEVSFADKVHPNEEGTSIIAENLVEYILENRLW